MSDAREDDSGPEFPDEPEQRYDAISNSGCAELMKFGRQWSDGI